MREVIMGYQGEMSLKGLNRNQFESTMMKILRYRLKTVGKFRVYCTQSTFYMEPEEEDIDMDLAFERVSKVFGLAALSRAVVCEKDFDTICQTAEDYLGDSLHGIKTFKVEARRSDTQPTEKISQRITNVKEELRQFIEYYFCKCSEGGFSGIDGKTDECSQSDYRSHTCTGSLD